VVYSGAGLVIYLVPASWRRPAAAPAARARTATLLLFG